MKTSITILPELGSLKTTINKGIYQGNTPHISEWRTTAPNETVTLPYQTTGTYTGIIDWGDGTQSVNSYDNRTHTYATPGYYTITVYGRLRVFRFANTGDRTKLYRVFQWGSQFNLGTGGSQFYGCTNLDLSEVSDVLQLYDSTLTLAMQTRNFTNMFRACTSLTTINRVNEWDMSNVFNLSGCFLGATNFNDNLNSWNTSSVTSMLQMFFNASTFDNDITDWNTSNVTNFGQMFYNATSFNVPIGVWDVSNGTIFSTMFRNASSFDRDLSQWDTSNATDMNSMFRSATAFNQNIGNWDIKNCLNFTNFMLGKTFSDYSTANYDALLIGWASRPVQPNINISFGTIKRTITSTVSKLILTSAPNNWTIVDGGL